MAGGSRTWKYNEPGSASFSYTTVTGQTHTFTITDCDVEADFKIGDGAYARCRVYGLRYVHTSSSGSSSAQYKFSGIMDILDIYGAGDTYKSTDVEAAEFLYGDDQKFTRSWSVSGNTKDTIVIPDGITSIGDFLFDGLSTSSRIANKYARTSNPDASGAFNVSWGFEDYEDKSFDITVVLGSGIKSIGSSAFRYPATTRRDISKIVNIINNSYIIEKVGTYAFRGQYAVKVIDFHNAQHIRVDGGAFSGCESLESVNLSDDWYGLDYSGPSYETFYKCFNLHTISPNNVIHTIQGNMYRDCNNLDRITINQDKIDSTFSNSLYVDLGAGSVLDDEGYFITEVNSDSTIPPEIAEFDWKNKWHRIIVYRTFLSVHLFHLGRHIEISCYNKGDIPLTHKDIMFFLKWVELNGTESHNEQTPLHVAHNGKWYQICY